MTSNESTEVCSDAGMIDNDASQEMTSNESNEMFGDAGMKCNNASEEMTANESTQVCSDAGMVDSNTSEEVSLEMVEKQKDKKMIDVNSTSPLGLKEPTKFIKRGSSTVGGTCSESEWGYKVIHVNSSDLQVIEDLGSEETRTRDRHHNNTQMQNRNNGATSEAAPGNKEQSHEKADQQVVSLNSKNVSPKFVHPTDEVSSHNDGSYREELIKANIKPGKLEQLKDNEETRGETRKVDSRRTLSTRVKEFKCSYCGKVFTRQSHFKRHEYIHTGVSPFKCKYCGKMFRNNWDVEVHERIHTGIKPFRCNLCNKTFTQRSGLNVHGRVHTGITPYHCNHCTKAFTRKSHLMEHERIHTGDKPHKCSLCDKAFTQKGTLRKHENTHSGFKPYKCPQCEKSFSRKSDLTKHELSHSGV